MSDVVVYGRANCVQCTATGRKLQAVGVDYAYRDVSDPAAAREAQQVAERLGVRQLPLVVAGDQEWAGYRPDRIARLSPPEVGAASREWSPAPTRTMSLEVG
ncbi:glutaredoxin family protein [uncultured Actinomyces sp.]|uniref:glutaredoxin family protein n=1 Tax=uncultured Actinomyces sp. TaxID=249061 RepID=UPI0028D8800A|nr:glutaredoxin family protein [uncultured Actinomyces sp.]